MSDEEKRKEEEQGFESLRDQFQDQDKELELPKFIDANRVEGLRERKKKTVDEINRIMKGIPKGETVKEKQIFVMPGESEPTVIRKVGERWTDNDGRDWIQHDGWKEKVPKIEDRSFILPWACPRCKKSLKHWLDQKMWRLYKICHDCVAEKETEMQINGTWKDYEKGKMMANVRSWYNEVVNSIDDYVESFFGDYINSFGDVEEWKGGLTRESIKERLEKDLEELRESFENEFGEPLLLENGDGILDVDKGTS